jgi:hypothetical protein
VTVSRDLQCQLFQLMEKINSRVKTKDLLEVKKFSVSDMANEVNYSKLSNLSCKMAALIEIETTEASDQFNIFS